MSTDTNIVPDASADTRDDHALDDTIAAIATPPGAGGIGIVRISGPDAFAIGLWLFRAADHAYRETPPPSHLLTYGHAIEPQSGEALDEVLAAFMRAPRTYTREDVVELHAHGGPLLLRHILAAALAAGARAARPGEMTLRAFLHGRLDLAQAEAVMALINAESDAGRRLALRQLEGALSAAIGRARTGAEEALTAIEASVDFPEEEVPEPERDALARLIGASEAEVRRLLAGAEHGRVLAEGLRVAIVGRPNVGKSSLLNALLRSERAIVTPIAGTTRDTIEERAALDGLALHLVDTAGLSPSEDPIERIGVERSRAAARTADLLLFVLDGSAPLDALDHRAADDLRALRDTAQAEDGAHALAPVLVAVNKADLPQVVTVANAAALWPAAPIVHTSAVAVGGTEALERTIAALAGGGQAASESALVSSARHADALRRAAEALAEARAALGAGIPLDLISVDLRAALDALGEVTGETATADLLDRIFAAFCIGK
ncbi:MAG TPA: tRNA uridine-5-carboxymethylaminomethyl(34) synthesis GTPase MnmE [Ktedonobacterales bacterium]